MDNNQVNAAEAKKNFSELPGRVAYGKERIVISKRGRPMALLVPVTEGDQNDHLSKVRGWLEEDDPFFETIQNIVSGRAKHTPRVLRERQD